jgi:hypothetical protein
MSERRSSKNALRLAQCAHEVLEKHGRNPELAIDDFVSIVRAESEALMNEITPDDVLRQLALSYLRAMAAGSAKI